MLHKLAQLGLEPASLVRIGRWEKFKRSTSVCCAHLCRQCMACKMTLQQLFGVGLYASLCPTKVLLEDAVGC